MFGLFGKKKKPDALEINMDASNLPPELRERMEKMVHEITDNLIGQGPIDTLEASIQGKFKKKGIPFSVSTLKAYREGVHFMGMAGMDGDKQMIAMLAMTVEKLVAQHEKRFKEHVKKTNIQNL